MGAGDRGPKKALGILPYRGTESCYLSALPHHYV